MVKILRNTIVSILVILFHNTNTKIFIHFCFSHIILQQKVFNLQSFLFTLVTIVQFLLICIIDVSLVWFSNLLSQSAKSSGIMTYTLYLTLKRLVMQWLGACFWYHSTAASYVQAYVSDVNEHSSLHHENNILINCHLHKFTLYHLHDSGCPSQTSIYFGLLVIFIFVVLTKTADYSLWPLTGFCYHILDSL